MSVKEKRQNDQTTTKENWSVIHQIRCPVLVLKTAVTARLSKHDELLSLLLRQKEIRKSPGFFAAFEHVVRHNDSPEMTKLFIEAMQDGEFVPVQRND